MSARLTLTLIVAGALVLPSSAAAATKNGVTPVAPKAGKSVPAGKRPTFKVRANGRRAGVGPRLQVQEEGQGRA